VTDYGRRTMAGEEPLLRAAVRRAEIAITSEVRRTIPGARVTSFGAIDLYPSCLAFWICVATDAQRDSLLGDVAFSDRMRRIVADCGYPADSVDRVGFTSESDETVDRDWAGNWYHAMK
jgi:hypothetical protein